MVNRYIFNEGIEFKKIARRYDSELMPLLQILKEYVEHRHDETFSIQLQRLAGCNEPFIKNELKPTIIALCHYFDSSSLAVTLLTLKSGFFILCDNRSEE